MRNNPILKARKTLPFTLAQTKLPDCFINFSLFLISPAGYNDSLLVSRHWMVIHRIWKLLFHPWAYTKLIYTIKWCKVLNSTRYIEVVTALKTSQSTIKLLNLINYQNLSRRSFRSISVVYLEVISVWNKFKENFRTLDKTLTL